MDDFCVKLPIVEVAKFIYGVLLTKPILFQSVSDLCALQVYDVCRFFFVPDNNAISFNILLPETPLINSAPSKMGS